MSESSLPCRKSELIWLRWIDASGESCRVHVDDVHNLHSEVNTNVGWVVAENDSVLRLAHGNSTTGELDVLKVPLINILERIPIITPRKKKDGKAKGEAKGTIKDEAEA